MTKRGYVLVTSRFNVVITFPLNASTVNHSKEIDSYFMKKMYAAAVINR